MQAARFIEDNADGSFARARELVFRCKKTPSQ
jgi:hypothetical protein